MDDDLPGLPPTVADAPAAASTPVDPFAGLDGASSSSSSSAAAGPVDPFAGLSGSSSSSTPAAAPTKTPSVGDKISEAAGVFGTQMDQMAQAFNHNVIKPFRGATQLLEHGANAAAQAIAPGSAVANATQGLVNQDDAALAQNEKQYQAQVPNGPGALVGATMGSVAPFAFGAGALNAAGSAAATPLSVLAGRLSPGASQLLARASAGIVNAGTQGAIAGATSPVTSGPSTSPGAANSGDPSQLLLQAAKNAPQSFMQQKLSQMGSGAQWGIAGATGANVAGRMISPNVSPDVQTLMNAGITPTPGQISQGIPNTIEQSLTGVPVLGDLIKAARGRAASQLNTAVANRALAPIGQTVEAAPGRDMVDEVHNKLSDAYNTLLPQMNFTADPQFGQDMGTLLQGANQMPQPQAQAFNNVLVNKVFARIGPQGQMDGATLKGVQEELGDLARGYQGDPSFDQRQLGTAIDQARQTIDATVARGNPAGAQQLAAINQGWANYSRLRAASSMIGARDGVFSPANLQNAVKAGDKSSGKGAFAGGNAFMQDLSDPALSVLGGTVPDTGTAGRVGATAAVTALLMHPQMLLHPSTYAMGAAAAAPAAMYTQAGQRAMAAALTSRPAWAPGAAQGLNAIAPGVSAGLLDRN